MMKKWMSLFVLVFSFTVCCALCAWADEPDKTGPAFAALNEAGFAEAASVESRPVGIISAMDNEIRLLLKRADIDHVDHIGGRDFHVGTLCGREVVIVKAGVGKVRAAAGVAALLNMYDPSAVLFTGIAGGVGDETKVLDVVVATGLVQHDYGQITNDGFEWSGRSGGCQGLFICDSDLVSLAFHSAAVEAGSEHVFKGIIATGDQFVASEDYVNVLQQYFNAIACEMEGAAIASVCTEYDVPFVVIRTMSDKADGVARKTYENMADEAADQSCRIVVRMLEEMEPEQKIPVRVLILPKFEVGDMTGDFPGEAQYYYENYLAGGEEYEIAGGSENIRLYVKDGVALCLLGMGKVQATVNTMAVLGDERFDFSDACIISTGCAGSAAGYGTMGDVFIGTAAIDYDLGHRADSRELEDETSDTWFHDPDFDENAVIRLNPDLSSCVYDLVKDMPLETTERTRLCMKETFGEEEWAIRDPKVLKGTTVTGDNYWKGAYDHRNAVKMAETYECTDPYAVTEMEDIAIGMALRHLGLLDHYVIIRDSVDMDVFMGGVTPEKLWRDNPEEMELASEDSQESADIFETAMKNNFAVGSRVIDAVLDGELTMP